MLCCLPTKTPFVLEPNKLQSGIHRIWRIQMFAHSGLALASKPRVLLLYFFILRTYHRAPQVSHTKVLQWWRYGPNTTISLLDQLMGYLPFICLFPHASPSTLESSVLCKILHFDCIKAAWNEIDLSLRLIRFLLRLLRWNSNSDFALLSCHLRAFSILVCSAESLLHFEESIPASLL